MPDPAPTPPDIVAIPDLVQILGEVAPRFGLSRPAGQCFAAIWRAAQAPSAEDLVMRLGLSRSNVSVALKELRAVGLTQTARSPGTRRDYFVADPDPWALVKLILAERTRRDLAPLAARLAASAATDTRAASLHEMLGDLTLWLDRIGQMAPADLARMTLRTPGKTDSAGHKKKKKRPKLRPEA